ncbi:unconventional myosin-VIIb-like isoform X3 [Xenia sp. Carnegie-2017]|uniref:unconventional myosin-VIIb-like isoform X2 n=1 Tax=Xenia sp. Carnegie-2017 TaxID=2897299 RepID=UPI001F03E6AB|nr:unconventional myosin-VIIb-like isoform X2 [Xenia sp. Carnegie-2017]XP_046852559.1 unconventional myosin-VIIb-like isoform X3 [Xenia sp. Carnegie-2017]
MLACTDQVDRNVAVVLWNTILRFMGDMDDIAEPSMEETIKGERASMLSSKSWILGSDRLRFIVGLGINRPHLRDEVYCQLCKQVTNNPSKTSLLKGWILISLCCGCFLPSKKVEMILIETMRCGPSDHVRYCNEKMLRTREKGGRKQPPNSLEIQASQQLALPVVLVELNDGKEVSVEVDSSTTARELCFKVSDETGNSHNADYGIQVHIMGKDINIGNGDEKVMDAIWVCEQSARELGYKEDTIPWKIYYRKEVYCPSDEFHMDISWTDFAYKFVVNNIKTRVSTKLKKRFSSTEKINDVSTYFKRTPSNESLVRQGSFSSVSSVGATNNFGVRRRTSRISDLRSAKLAEDKNTFIEDNEMSLQEICEDYEDSIKDVHTLEDYGKKFFTQTNISMNSAVETLCNWSHQTEPLKSPLLARLEKIQELSKLSLNMFLAILEYMQESRSSDRSLKYRKKELTVVIFNLALKHNALQDELYCQLMKQLTNNRNADSRHRGWELMFLTTSLFSCSEDVLKEVMLFYATWSKHEKMAMKCLTILRETVLTGPRMCPPHFVEYTAATKQLANVSHKVYFPDSTSKNFDVNARTKVKNLAQSIVQKLGLLNGIGYSLFIQVFSKTAPLQPEHFLFDAIQQWTQIVEKNLSLPMEYDKAKGIPYKLIFLRRVWTQVNPGDDPIADAVFIYPQEVYKYLRGYYKLGIDEVAYLAALILKYKYKSGWNCPEITQMLEEILPYNIIEDLFPVIWRHYILTNCEKIPFDSEKEIRLLFLHSLQKSERFGAAYFKVLQNQFRDSPKVIIIGINSKGIHVINPETMITIEMFPMENVLSHYGEEKGYTFQFQSTLETIQQIKFQTTQGYEIASMVEAYIPQ